MSSAATSILTGLIVAVIGLAVLTVLVLTAPEPEATSMATTTPAPTGTSGIEPASTIVTTPAPEIAGLPESITKTLVANGFAAREHTADLPPSVARVLSDAGIALTIAEEG